MTVKGEGKDPPRFARDDYETFRTAGSAMDYARLFGIDQIPGFMKMTEHPAYDAFWQAQAVDRLLAREPLTVPTMIVGALWDQEDIYGAQAVYAALEPKDTANDRLFFALGPWRHSGQNGDGTTLGPMKFDADTAKQFRREVMQPFLDQHLRDGAPPAATPPVVVYETGTQVWRRFDRWPQSCEQGCAGTPRPLYLHAASALAFEAPGERSDAFDEFVSDPAKPVPFVPRPVRFNDSDAWRLWLVTDQRSVVDRPDVLSWTTAPLTEPLRVSGIPMANLAASTSGTDADWVVKLIDVYPDEVPERPELGGYQLGIAMEVFRGRYRESFERPAPVRSGAVETYRFALPPVNHVFLPGHRIMVQVQSTWFPLYDRNPQTYVENIFLAPREAYQRATHRVHRSAAHASSVTLPVAPLLAPH